MEGDINLAAKNGSNTTGNLSTNSSSNSGTSGSGGAIAGCQWRHDHCSLKALEEMGDIGSAKTAVLLLVVRY